MMTTSEIVLELNKMQVRMVELCNDMQALKDAIKLPPKEVKLKAKEKCLNDIRATIDAHFKKGVSDE